MDTKKIIIAVVAIIVIIAAGLYVTGSLGTSTDSSLNGQDVQLAAAASLKNVYDEKLIPMFE